jgi:hypothetical protein
VNLLTLPRYLLGDRQSILEIAGCRGALLLGGLFVLSAGFAREYDGEDLLAEPWHVLLPLAASLGTSLLLGGLLYGVAWMRTEHPLGFGTFYRSFLALYWMTAPLAWLYAVPYERFLSPADAVRANQWTLGVVSLWRVLLITRASSVLLGGPTIDPDRANVPWLFLNRVWAAMLTRQFWAMLFPVLLFADVLVLVVLYFTPFPIINFMGGIRLTESERLIQRTVMTVGKWGLGTLPIWLVGTMIVASIRTQWAPIVDSSATGGRVSVGTWLLAVGSLAIWALILPRTQPEQQLRFRTERLLRSDRIAEGLAEMSAHERDDYPPHWDPPPRLSYGEGDPHLADIMEVLPGPLTAPWVREAFLEKLVALFHDEHHAYYLLRDSEDPTFDRYLAVLHRLPEGRRVARQICDAIVGWGYGRHSPNEITKDDYEKAADGMAETQRDRYESLLDLSGIVRAPDAEQLP